MLTSYRMKFLLESIKALVFLFLCLFLQINTYADDFPEKPNPPRLVNDFAGILNPGDAATLEAKLDAYNDTTSTQIAVVTMKNVGDYDVSDYAEKLAEKWQIGQKGKDNGILIFVASEQHKIWIATGYGMEGVVPDAAAKQIIDNYIKPAFKKGDYYKGLDDATTIIFKLSRGEYKADNLGGKKGNVSGWIILLIVLAFFIFKILFSRPRYNNFSNRGHRGGGGLWGGGFGGFGGGGFGGGSSGGGFGGFVGGSFGGGGA